MPQVPKPLCLIQFWNWKNSFFSLSALWGNKNWPLSIKMKQIENSHNKMGLKGCKWSSLIAPGIQTPLSHVILELRDFPIDICLWESFKRRLEACCFLRKPNLIWPTHSDSFICVANLIYPNLTVRTGRIDEGWGCHSKIQNKFNPFSFSQRAWKIRTLPS